jgi:HD-GYP domain-containing protein (c-di-GMP phosphodiesterase class II)
MRKLVAAHIVLGEPLSFSIYDERGNLLLRRGVTISMPDQVERLVLRGAMIEDTRPAAATETAAAQHAPAPAAAAPEPAYERAAGLVLNLKHIVGTALRTPEQIDLPARIEKVARAIQGLCAEDLDGMLAAPALDFQNPYIIVHQLMGAVLTEVIAARKGLAADERVSLMCAALTRDWGQLPAQGELESHAGPLSADLEQRMHAHPVQGSDMLRQAGVTDSCWLDAVRGHHERLDGSGYPGHLQGDAIPLGARILAVADMFSAMGKPRPYRPKPCLPQSALREIYLKIGSELDGELVNILIRQVGMFPPGTIVRLKCGEIAVVKSPTPKADGAHVYSVYGKTGTVLPAPVLRDTSQPEFEIAGVVPYAECKAAAVTIKRVWLGR